MAPSGLAKLLSAACRARAMAYVLVLSTIVVGIAIASTLTNAPSARNQTESDNAERLRVGNSSSLAVDLFSPSSIQFAQSPSLSTNSSRVFSGCAAPDAEVKCGNGSFHQCIPKWSMCDGVLDCEDGSDELEEICHFQELLELGVGHKTTTDYSFLAWSEINPVRAKYPLT